MRRPCSSAPGISGRARRSATGCSTTCRPTRSSASTSAPSLPFADRGAYFPDWPDSPPDARALWRLIDRICAADPHLAATSFVDHGEAARHFRRHGGRQGDRFEPGRGRLRATERAQQRMGLNPYSNLNLVGAAQVGKSSLTGMRVLAALDGRLPIWPFDPLPATGSVVAEIYTTIAALAAGRSKNRSKMRSWEDLDAALVHPAIASRPTASHRPGGRSQHRRYPDRRLAPPRRARSLALAPARAHPRPRPHRGLDLRRSLKHCTATPTFRGIRPGGRLSSVGRAPVL